MAKGTPEPKKGKGLLAWRSRQKRGSIMKPATFEKIKEKAKEQYGVGEERAAKVAGAAYWKTAQAKFRGKRKKRRNYSPEVISKVRERI